MGDCRWGLVHCLIFDCEDWDWDSEVREVCRVCTRRGDRCGVL